MAKKDNRKPSYRFLKRSAKEDKGLLKAMVKARKRNKNNKNKYVSIDDFFKTLDS